MKSSPIGRALAVVTSVGTTVEVSIGQEKPNCGCPTCTCPLRWMVYVVAIRSNGDRLFHSSTGAPINTLEGAQDAMTKAANWWAEQ